MKITGYYRYNDPAELSAAEMREKEIEYYESLIEKINKINSEEGEFLKKYNPDRLQKLIHTKKLAKNKIKMLTFRVINLNDRR